MFLDCAAVTGWCEGPLRGPLRYGEVRLAPPGSSMSAVFGGALKWLGSRLMVSRPRVLAYEAPLDPRHLKKINKQTIRQLNGIPAVFEAAAYEMGVYDIREAEVGDIRMYWLGKRNVKGELAKPMVRDKLRRLGYEPQSFDASDAIAGHRFIAAQIDPSLRNEPYELLRGA